MKKDIQIDIIMPCYYSSNIISPALEKIASQTAIKQIHLIMINDCSPFTNCNYEDLFNKYKDKINITLLKTEKNSGPGVARQLGLNNANGDFIFFHDDDDELIDNYSIQNLISIIPSNFSNIRIIKGGAILNEGSSICIYTGETNNILQGNLYNNHLIKKYNISFHPICSYREEDGAFLFEFYALTGSRFYDNCRDICINQIIYKRNYAQNHISLTQQGDLTTSILGLMNMDYACIETIYQNDKIDIIFKNNSCLSVKVNIGFLFNLYIDTIKNNNKLISIKEFLLFKDKVEFFINFINDYCLKNNIAPEINDNIIDNNLYYCLIDNDKQKKEQFFMSYQDFLQIYEQQLQYLYKNYVIKE